MKKLRTLLGKIISTVRDDIKDHVFIAVLVNWIIFALFAFFGVNAAVVFTLFYLAFVLAWEIFGDTGFSMSDIGAGILPILPTIILILIS